LQQVQVGLVVHPAVIHYDLMQSFVQNVVLRLSF